MEPKSVKIRINGLPREETSGCMEDEMKTVCYCMTRNLYGRIGPSLKSLLKNGNIDEVILIVEDDDIGIWLPENVRCVNVSNQQWFRPYGPNFHCGWTYMVMMRPALCKLFPEKHRLLTLDLDTIVLGDLSDLWELDLDGLCCAGAREPYWTAQYGRSYINGGVILWNLDMMRAGRADRVIDALNTKVYDYCEQDCVNEQLAGEILIIDSAYNASKFTEPPRGETKILHFAAHGMVEYMRQPVVREYDALEWSEVIR